jgi:hypothetical protein
MSVTNVYGNYILLVCQLHVHRFSNAISRFTTVSVCRTARVSSGTARARNTVSLVKLNHLLPSRRLHRQFQTVAPSHIITAYMLHAACALI